MAQCSTQIGVNFQSEYPRHAYQTGLGVPIITYSTNYNNKMFCLSLYLEFRKSERNFTKSLIRRTEGEISEIPSYDHRLFGSHYIHVQYICESQKKNKKHCQSSERTRRNKKETAEPDDRAVTLNHLDPFLVHVNLERDPIREHDAIARRSGAHTPSDAGHKSGL